MMDCCYTCERCNKELYSMEEAEAHITLCLEEMSQISEVNNNAGEKKKVEDPVEILISEVQSREPLWKNTLPYQERAYKITKVLWGEIDRILDKQPGTCQAKFKNLRDSFGRLLAENRKYKKSGSGGKDSEKSVTWEYYHQLEFLITAIEYRTTSTGLKKPKVVAPGPAQDTSTSLVTPTAIVSPPITSKRAGAAVQRNDQRNGGSTKKKTSDTSSASVTMDPFREYCYAQLEATNKPPDKIGAFCLYLGTEMREMDDQIVKRFTRDVTKLLLDAKEDSVLCS